MKVLGKIFSILIIIVIVIGGLSYLDYFLVKTNDSLPKLAIKKYYKEKDMTVYNALFYKVWYCNSDDTTILGDYKDPNPVCSNEYVFEDGYYTNLAGLKIKQRDLLLMIDNNIYTNEMIDIMSKQSEVDNAIYVVESYGKTFYEKVDSKKGKVDGDDTEYDLVASPSFTEVDGTYKWNIDLADEESYYCVSTLEDEKVYSKYTDGFCEQEFKPLKMEDKWCELYQNTTLAYKEDEIKVLCKE